MAKGNDKKVVKHARDLFLIAFGNLLESHRERRFTYAQRATPLPRRVFCDRNNLVAATVAHIETGRFLGLNISQMRLYLATTHGLNDKAFLASLKKVYDGLKEIDALLKKL